MTLTSSIGNFIFRDECRLSQAKLIRDTIMGQYKVPSDGVRLRDEQDCLNHAVAQFKEDGMHLTRVILN